MSCALLGVRACVDDCVGGLPCQNVYRSATPVSFTVNIGQFTAACSCFQWSCTNLLSWQTGRLSSLCVASFFCYIHFCNALLVCLWRFYGKPVTETIVTTTTIGDGTLEIELVWSWVRTCLRRYFHINKAHFSDSWRHPITGLHLVFLTLSLCANCILLLFHLFLTIAPIQCWQICWYLFFTCVGSGN